MRVRKRGQSGKCVLGKWSEIMTRYDLDIRKSSKASTDLAGFCVLGCLEAPHFATLGLTCGRGCAVVHAHAVTRRRRISRRRRLGPRCFQPWALAPRDNSQHQC